MTIEALSAIASALPSMNAAAAGASITGATPMAGTFDKLVHSLQDINAQMSINQQAIESLAVGQSDDLHRVMMNLESTKLAFDLTLQIRNKVLDAYQELMRMQV